MPFLNSPTTLKSGMMEVTGSTNSIQVRTADMNPRNSAEFSAVSSLHAKRKNSREIVNINGDLGTTEISMEIE